MLSLRLHWQLFRSPKAAQNHCLRAAPLPQAQQNHLSQIWRVDFTLGTLGLLCVRVNPVLLCNGGGLLGPVQFELRFTSLSCVLWKFILGLLHLPPYDLLLGSRAKQLALKLCSPAEGRHCLFLLRLAAEMTCIGNLFLIPAQSCARPLCTC